MIIFSMLQTVITVEDKGKVVSKPFLLFAKFESGIIDTLTDMDRDYLNEEWSNLLQEKGYKAHNSKRLLELYAMMCSAHGAVIMQV